MEIIRFRDRDGGRCFVGQVLNDTAVAESAPGEGCDEDGRRTCVDGFGCEEGEVGSVVRGADAAGGFLVVVAELFEMLVDVRLHKVLKVLKVLKSKIQGRVYLDGYVDSAGGFVSANFVNYLAPVAPGAEGCSGCAAVAIVHA